MEQSFFGKTKRGQDAALYTFRNQKGMAMAVSDLGATLQSVIVPTKQGASVDVILGYDAPSGYEGPSMTYLGSTVGRNANRIAKSAFSLNGKHYTLPQCDGENNLHSGPDSYAFRIWEVKAATENSITFFLHSPDGDQGFPGALDLDVTYTLTEDAVRIDYLGTADQDTIINLTHHSAFNLNGHASGLVTEHLLWVDADTFVPIDSQCIPTGQLQNVADTPMDFRQEKAVGRDIDAPHEALQFTQGYDHNWCLNSGEAFAKAAALRSDSSGLTMEVYTDLPGLQIFSCNDLFDEPGKQGVVYHPRWGICLEPQYYPDSIHNPQFPCCIRKAGQPYQKTILYRFI